MQDNQASLVNEIEQAKSDWLHAWENFRNAESEFVEASIYELNAKEEKYRVLLRLAQKALLEKSYLPGKEVKEA